MRRHLLTVPLVAVVATTLAVGALGAAPVGAETACAGDRVSATINAPSLPGGGWSVTDACVDARDYFTGTYEDSYPYAVGISAVTYDDGHVGRLAFLAVQLAPGHRVRVVGMEAPSRGQLRCGGPTGAATVEGGGAKVAGQAVTFPPLEVGTVRLDYTDTPAALPDWATTTTTSLPSPPGVPTTSPATTTTAPDGGATTTTTSTSLPEATTTTAPA